MQPLIKVCRVCKLEKALEAFHPNKSCKLGVIGTCRECVKSRLQPWLDKTKSKRSAVTVGRNRKRKADMVAHFGGKCLDCKGEFPQCVYEFHHLDPSQKDVNPSKAMTWTEERMWAELSKCIMLCANCHKIRHFGGE